MGEVFDDVQWIRHCSNALKSRAHQESKLIVIIRHLHRENNQQSKTINHNEKMSGIKVVFGSAGVNPGAAFGSPEALQDVFDVLEKGNVKTIDTAALYGQSEEILGKAGAGKRFTLDTKLKGGFGNGSSKDVIQDEATNSKKMLGVDVDILYIHAPDHETPLEETLAAVDAVHKSGFFKRFGLSNYQAKDVEAVYNHAKEKGYVLPTV